MDWSKLFFFIIAALLCWWCFRIIRNQKASFTKANVSKTMSTLGILALILIAFVGLCIMLLKHS